jgi:hypothetical protein
MAHVTDEIRDRLIELLKDVDGFTDVSAVDGEDGTIGFYDDETGHDYFIKIEPA